MIRTLESECERRGLPVDFPTLIQHIENNHACTLGFKDMTIETWKARAELAEATIGALEIELAEARSGV